MDRLVDMTLTASLFAADAHDRDVPARARTVIVGAGIAGSSAAYHLGEQGDSDVLVLDSNVLGSGSTWHAAGLVSSIRPTPAMTELAAYGIKTYQSLGAASGIDVSFNQSGSLLLARTPGRLDELRYTAIIARYKDIPAHLISADEVANLWPLVSTDKLLGALHQPEDGHVNPGYAALAFAKLAHQRGVTFREHVRVTGLRQINGVVVGVDTTLGPVECERVLLAGGLWTRDLAAMAGANVPLYAAEHIHVRTERMPGADPSLPVLRDLDGYFYIRPESGRLLVGAFEPDGLPRSVDSIGDSGFAQFPAAWDHFAAVRRSAEERVPDLRNTRFERFLNAPESFTPDANFCIGETAEVANLYVAAGFNSQGIIYGPGAGRAVAEWMAEGSPTFDAALVDVRRFAKQQSNRRYLHARTREGLGRLYAMHWPQSQPSTARGVRRTPLHQRMVEANACFGETAGWERANWFAPPGTEPRYDYSYGRQNWFDVVGQEHRAAREAVALFDLSSFTKIEVAGPDACAVLQVFCTADVDLPVGRVRYTLMLNKAGGVELDGTVVRLDEDRFWVITPAASQHRTFEQLKRLTRGRAAAVFDATAGYATLAVMGPSSRELMARVSPADWSDEAQPYGGARMVEVADGHALCLRISFVGELGYEVYPPADQAVNVYDALVAAGSDLGLRHAGYHALDSLRSEKGYRHLGHDIGPVDDPYEAGLGFTVSLKKSAQFIGRDAVERRSSRPHERKAVYLALKDPAGLLVHDEPVLVDGRVVGRLTSGSYGYTLGRAVGLASIATNLPPDAEYLVDCGGIYREAEISDQPFYDPTNSRLRG
jgi:glycine cleavage system aminomethyltransferase T/glycine/D-amino acid oxidase-like deaminating enzyme